VLLVNTVLYTSINTDLAFSKEALVALAIDTFEKGQKSYYILQLLFWKLYLTLYTNVIIVL
jgi:hypothetical protein